MMTNWRFIKYQGSVLVFAVIFVSCFQSDYTKLVKSELARGIRNDSILLGIKFGDSRDDFFGRCFDLNREHLVTQGPSGLSVQYLFTDSLFHYRPTQIRLLFSPSFDVKNRISDMEMKFNYVGWAPWNKHLQSDSLEVKMKEILMNWYSGNNFITAKAGDKIWPVKLDANRRILISKEDSQTILVSVQDILHPKFQHSITKGREDKSK
jgi:hypothetical protein